MDTERYQRWMVYEHDLSTDTQVRTWVFESAAEADQKVADLWRDGRRTRLYHVAAVRPPKENNGRNR